MRCHAYVMPKEAYAEVEAQILEQVAEGDREQLLYLLTEHDLDIELLSGEWRVLFHATKDAYYQVIDWNNRITRMVVSPEELADFVKFLRDPQRQEHWRPITFGLAELIDALPPEVDLAAVVFVEESDDWMWVEPVFELVAIRPEVFELLEVHMRKLLEVRDFAALARVADEHSEGAVEFSWQQWQNLMQQTRERAPELIPVIDGGISVPADYTGIREALGVVADPEFQPSLDAWLRVHAASAQYALYFHNATLERRQVYEDPETDPESPADQPVDAAGEIVTK